MNTPWTYESKDFLEADADAKILEGYLGFVYEITDNTNGKKYLGKKLFQSVRRLPPLKSAKSKRKRKKVVHSDWQTYYGSSEYLKTLVEERIESFSREILFLCKSKGELSYVEAREQFTREVLLSDAYYNGIISCRINHKHVKALWKINEAEKNQQSIEKMAEAFCSWNIPKSVCPDECILDQNYPHRTGTNFLNIEEAKEMIRHILGA